MKVQVGKWEEQEEGSSWCAYTGVEQRQERRDESGTSGRWYVAKCLTFGRLLVSSLKIFLVLYLLSCRRLQSVLAQLGDTKSVLSTCETLISLYTCHLINLLAKQNT